jgi:hypothetical protein
VWESGAVTGCRERDDDSFWSKLECCGGGGLTRTTSQMRFWTHIQVGMDHKDSTVLGDIGNLQEKQQKGAAVGQDIVIHIHIKADIPGPFFYIQL